MDVRPSPIRSKESLSAPSGLAAGLVAVAIVVLLYLSGTFDRLEYGIYDSAQSASTSTTAASKVAVVAVDNASLAALGQWPFPRRYHARLVTRLHEAGAKVIALDLLLTEPDRVDPAGDAALSSAIARSGQVILAVSGSYKALAPGAGLFELLPPLLNPLPAISAGRANLGHVLVMPEPDGVVRRLPLYASIQGRRVPSLALQAALRYGAAPGAMPATDRAGRWWIDFRPRSSWETFSYADVLAGRYPPETFRGKVVLVGATGSGFHDYYATPVAAAGDPTPGLLIHAQAVSDLLGGETIRWAPRWAVVLLIAILGFLPSLIAAGRKKRARGSVQTALLTLTGLAAFTAAAFYSFNRFNLWMPLTPVWFGAVLGGASAIGHLSLQIERERARLRLALSRYLSPQVLAELLSRPGSLSLGGQRARVTVLFADLRGFTSFAEGRNPEEAVQVLNIYLQTIAAAVLERRGTLDKFMGDGVMAIFGAPAPLSDHAQSALSCAADILQRVATLNRSRRERGETTLEVGLGIATGDALVGNIGSATRMDYTAIGDVVNLAARLEKEAKPGEAVITLETVDGSPTRPGASRRDDLLARGELRAVAPIVVRGRTEPVRVAVFVTAITEIAQSPRHN